LQSEANSYCDSTLRPRVFVKSPNRLIKFGAAAILVALIVADHAGLFAAHLGDDRTRYHGAVATIVYVTDGDTFDVDIPDRGKPKTRIRLWGVDCPEIAHNLDESDAWYGREAADFVQEHFDRRRVRLALDPNRSARDKYGRLLAYVYAADSGEMLNETLVTEGLAYADRRFEHIFRYRFTQLENRARKDHAGLWNGVEPRQMPAWRRRMLAQEVIRDH